MLQIRFDLFSKYSNLAFLALILVFCDCTAPIQKLKCQEIRFRNNRDSTQQDSNSSAGQELEECEKEAAAASAHDSTFMENLNRRFTPVDSL